MSAVSVFEELVDANGNIYKLKGKLSRWKEVNVTFLPDSEMLFVHISDIKNAFEGGKFNKAKSKSVSISIEEAEKMQELLYQLKGHTQRMKPVSIISLIEMGLAYVAYLGKVVKSVLLNF